MSEQANVERVKELYAAFERGDIGTVSEGLTADVSWTTPGSRRIPFAGRRTGREDAMQFFAGLGETVEFTGFAPRDFLAQGDRVVVLGSSSGRIKPTGRDFATEWAHVFTFGGREVTSFVEYTDTEHIAEAFGAG